MVCQRSGQDIVCVSWPHNILMSDLCSSMMRSILIACEQMSTIRNYDTLKVIVSRNTTLLYKHFVRGQSLYRSLNLWRFIALNFDYRRNGFCLVDNENHHLVSWLDCDHGFLAEMIWRNSFSMFGFARPSFDVWRHLQEETGEHKRDMDELQHKMMKQRIQEQQQQSAADAVWLLTEEENMVSFFGRRVAAHWEREHGEFLWTPCGCSLRRRTWWVSLDAVWLLTEEENMVSFFRRRVAARWGGEHGEFLWTLCGCSLRRRTWWVSLHSTATTKGPLKCFVTLFSWKFDTHPLPRNVNNVDLYTFETLFCWNPNTPTPYSIT